MSDETPLTAELERLVILDAAEKAAKHHKAELVRIKEESIARFQQQEIGLPWARRLRTREEAEKAWTDLSYFGWDYGMARRRMERAQRLVKAVSSEQVFAVRLPERDILLLREFLP